MKFQVLYSLIVEKVVVVHRSFDHDLTIIKNCRSARRVSVIEPDATILIAGGIRKSRPTNTEVSEELDSEIAWT